MNLAIVNMIPASLSGETNNDTEPNIAVNPANVQQIAGTTFTPDPGGGTQGPVFRSVNGGNTWDFPDFFPTVSLTEILNGAMSPTLDQTLRFAGTSNILYASYLDASLNLQIVKKTDLTTNVLATALYTKAATGGGGYYFDQPYIEAYTVMGGSSVNLDRIYVGGNDWVLNNSNPPASIIQSLDAGIASPVFNEHVLESRTVTRNGPQVRIAAHPDGTVYAIFYSYTSSDSVWPSVTANVTIVRDDNWGSGTSPYTDLKDTDSLAGVRIATGIQFTFDYSLGGERTAGDLSIAVDPTNSQNVYVAWSELLSDVYTLHVMSSSQGGKAGTWSNDLFANAITNATHPCLTINSQGKIGFLYQQITGTGSSQTWQTHFRTSVNGTAWDDTILCTAINSPGLVSFDDFSLGDYTHIMSVGKNFYGIFPADNTPNRANFPATATVTFNRNHNFTTKQLFANNGTTLVADSVDPFFFVAEELTPDQDFYVRKWTNSAADCDQGQEPCINPVFYETSDIWNSATNATGAMVNDWYLGDPANKGAGTLGNNYAFARISRNATGSANTVAAQFLYADYGLGIPYASIGSQNIPFATGDLSNLTAGQLWNLPASASSHVCLGIQVSTTTDAFIPPGLVGYVPGWPYPDLMVLNDNNKSQRNLTTVLVTAGMSNGSFMRVRNASNITRDMIISWNTAQSRDSFPKAVIGVVGGASEAFSPNGTILLKNMKPGENRWLNFSFESYAVRDESAVSVNFFEMSGNQAVNGCAILIKQAPLSSIILSMLRFQLSVLYRLGDGFGIKIDDTLGAMTAKLLNDKGNISQADYLKHITVFHEKLNPLISTIPSDSREDHKISFENEFKILSNANQGNLADIISAHGTLLNKIDISLTMKLIEGGDLACILSNMNYQVYLYSNKPGLKKLTSTSAMLDKVKKFMADYSEGKASNNEYPAIIKESIPCFNETAKQGGLKDAVANIEKNINSLQALQKAHYDYLLMLSDQ